LDELVFAAVPAIAISRSVFVQALPEAFGGGSFVMGRAIAVQCPAGGARWLMLTCPRHTLACRRAAPPALLMPPGGAALWTGTPRKG